MDANVPEMYRRSQLLAQGFSDHELRTMRRAGALSLLRRGCYLSGSRPAAREVEHGLLVRAAFGSLAAGAVVSHVSAAVLHGLPVWDLALQRVHVTRVRASGARRDRQVHMHAARLEPDEIVDVAGLPTTSVARTVVDIARSVSLEHAVVVADAALADGLDGEELAEVLRRSSRRPGSPKARRAVAFADGRSESVGESRSRVRIALAGLPPPVPQWEVRDRHGRLVGRVDLGWPEYGVVGEFDGEIKYGRLLRPGQRPGDVVFREKCREDELRAQELTVVRWTWRDLDAFDAKLERLRSALGMS